MVPVAPAAVTSIAAPASRGTEPRASATSTTTAPPSRSTAAIRSAIRISCS
jgi:hypothetical protein